MSVPLRTERRMLTEAEFEVVRRTHYPDICRLSEGDLAETARRVRDYRDKARDVSRRQRRELRGKADPRGVRPARDDTGTSIKRQIFASALRRVNKEIRRFEGAGSRGEGARRAFEGERARRAERHPSARGRPAAGAAEGA